MTPALCLAQFIVVVVFAPFSHPSLIGGRDLILLLSLGVGQMALGVVFLMIGARIIPTAEVALISLLDVVLGPVWVWLVLSESPGTSTLVGGTIVIAAVALLVSRPSQLEDGHYVSERV